jgi:hypothetical protein
VALVARKSYHAFPSNATRLILLFFFALIMLRGMWKGSVF